MTLLTSLYKVPGSVSHIASGKFINQETEQFLLVRGSIVLELWSFDQNRFKKVWSQDSFSQIR